MGIQDRDYYRDQYRASARPMRADIRQFPKQRASPLWIVLTWICVGLALFLMFDHWALSDVEAHRTVVPSQTSSALSKAAESARRSRSANVAVPDHALSSPATGSAAPRSPATTIYRCGQTYGTEPCPNGRVVDTSIASGFDSRPLAKLADRVASGRAVADVGAYVSGSTTTTVQYSTESPCPGLASQLEAIDADARRPHPPPYLDYLRARRQQVRDTQASSHC